MIKILKKINQINKYKINKNKLKNKLKNQNKINHKIKNRYFHL